ncbi:type II toxin-antitoxin system VapC family toxin [Sphingopyxis sp. NJF-3]
MSFTLDASAILAVLFDEPGGDHVFAHLNGSEISAVNLSEVYATLLDGGMDFDKAREIIAPLPMRIRSFREEHSWQVAQLRPLTKPFGLSLGDRACITQAMFNELPVLTADRRMESAKSLLGVDIRLIR